MAMVAYKSKAHRPHLGSGKEGIRCELAVKITYFFFQSLIVEKKRYSLNVFRFKPLPRKGNIKHHN